MGDPETTRLCRDYADSIGVRRDEFSDNVDE